MSTRDKISGLVALGVLILIPIISGFWADHLREVGIPSIATVESGNHKNLDISYVTRQGATKITISRPYEGIIPGERYSMRYNEKYTRDVTVLFWQPVYNKKAFVPANLESISEAVLIGGNVIVVTYTVNGRSLERYLELPPSFDMGSLTTLRLLYDPTNPQISYVELPDSAT